MRVIECNFCGETLSAANDEELKKALVGHMASEHEGEEFDPEGADQVIEENAYSAEDS